MGEGISAGTEPICERDTQPMSDPRLGWVRVLGGVWVRVLGGVRVRVLGGMLVGCGCWEDVSYG